MAGRRINSPERQWSEEEEEGAPVFWPGKAATKQQKSLLVAVLQLKESYRRDIFRLDNRVPMRSKGEIEAK